MPNFITTIIKEAISTEMSFTDYKLKIMIYAPVQEKKMLLQGFYKAEADGLRSDQRVVSVTTTNSLKDVALNDYDGLICYFYSYTAIGSLITRCRGIPTVATGGGEQVFYTMASNWLIYVLRILAFIASGLLVRQVLATSKTDLKEMRRVYPLSKNKIQLSYHGISAAMLASPANYRHYRPEHSMITICNMDTEANVRRKGMRKAIDLLAKMRQHYPDASLTVIGRTACIEVVKQFARSQNVSDAIHFVGYVSEEEKFRLLKSHRFYVQLSEYEGFGIGALEAIALGCQPLHSNAGGLRDTLADYGTVIDPEKLDNLDVTAIPAYAPPDWEKFSDHIAQFCGKERAKSILNAMGFPSEANSGAIKSSRILQ